MRLGNIRLRRKKKIPTINLELETRVVKAEVRSFLGLNTTYQYQELLFKWACFHATKSCRAFCGSLGDILYVVTHRIFRGKKRGIISR